MTNSPRDKLVNAMKGASLFIDTTDTGRCILNVSRNGKKLYVSARVPRSIIPLTQAHLRTMLRSPCDRIDTFLSSALSLSLSLHLSSPRVIVEGPNNITFRSSRFQRYHRGLEGYRLDKIIEMLSRWTLIASA